LKLKSLNIVCGFVTLIGLSLSQIATALEPLPDLMQTELGRLKIPLDAISVVVYQRDIRGAMSSGLLPILSHNPSVLRNPASLMKLVTTSVAMDLLGPAYTWSTQVYLDGPIEEGVLKGNLFIKGRGDPRFGVERLWLLMRRIRGLGIVSIQGDIVLDHKAFEMTAQDPSEFDGEPLRPYNASPDAFLINFKSLLINFVPDLPSKVVRIHVEPPLQGVSIQSTAPLLGVECSDYRAALRANFQDPNQITFKGGYPQGCGERLWPIAYADSAHFIEKSVYAMWTQVGGSVRGRVQLGEAPRNQKPILSMESPELSEVIRDINKFSNNVMAQQLFLTLGLELSGSGTEQAAQGVMNKWWNEKLGSPLPKFVNGSGLSRETKISADDLAKLLVWESEQPTYPEMVASLPLIGIDGTLRLSKVKTSGHLKTGSLKDVLGIAGYLQNKKKEQFIVVAIINHPKAQSAKTVMDYLIEWVGAY
jgi:D-alanyl-D-alanine carboxypeptidase/D-alanyl-D-alanine-endopeptidase (penicillin-binding protein 4)